MTSNQEYWTRRFLQIKAKQLKDTEAYEKALQPELNGLFREIRSEVEMWTTKYANTNDLTKDEARKTLAGIQTKSWKLTLKQFEERAKKGGYEDELNSEYYRSQIARLYALESQLKEIGTEFAQEQVPKMSDSLTQQYNDTYMRTVFTLQVAHAKITNEFDRFNEVQLRIAVSQPWGKDGKDFSKRIWKNYQEKLPDLLMNHVLKGTLLGYSPDRIVRNMHAGFQDVKRNDIHRLVISEMGHVAEEASAIAYEKEDIEYYEYMATLESHTCEICGALDGQRFKLSERKPGVNYPIIHPRCRCTTVPYMEGLPDIQKRWSRDPETGKSKLVKNMKFDEWKDTYVTGKSIESSAQRAKPKIGSYDWNEPNVEQYNKHVKGTPEYNNYVAGRKMPASELIIDIGAVQALITQYGNATEVSGNNQIKFQHDSYIGKWKDVHGNEYLTKKGRISYSKKGVHITPLKPDYLN